MSQIASRSQLRAAFFRRAVVCVPLVLLLGFAAGRIFPSGSDNAWYVALAKPALTPPGWVFPIAWSALYIMLGLALAIILSARRAPGRGLAVTLFAVQFAANLCWSPLFFGLHEVKAAIVLIAVMLGLSILVTFRFAAIRRSAAWLMVPYMVWISFAGLLTLGIHQLNPDAEELAPNGATTQILL